MNYNEAISYLENCHKFGSKQGHKNFKSLMSLFGEPQKKLKFIHVAGTNGKGSTCAMIHSILKEQGYTVGSFSSPHLEKYNERFKINDEYISDDDFARHISLVKDKVNELFDNTDEFFSFFEIITAVAFNYFYEKNVDFVVLEVGLGGRLDSTNIIEKPLISVIATVSFDHTEYLGETIPEITREKAGIIKNNSYTVLYSQSKEVYNIVNEICTEKESKLLYVDDYGVDVIKQDLDGTVFNVKNKYYSYDKISISLLGEYQVYNACNALMAIEALKEQGIEISSDAIYLGLKKAKINGRMEIISKKPLFILEGAHNTEGTSKLNSFLKRLKSSNKKITIVIGILKDKNYSEMLRCITEYADNIIFTEVDSQRVLKTQELFEAGHFENKNVILEDDFKKAVIKALEISSDDDCIVCTGSLYLVGDILKYINQKYGRLFDD